MERREASEDDAGKLISESDSRRVVAFAGWQPHAEPDLRAIE